MKDTSRLPYLWKIVVAAAAVAVGIVVVRELPQWMPARKPPAADSAGLYDDTLSRVRETIAAHTASVPEVVTPTMPLADLGVDPLTRVEVAEALEAIYRIELPTGELSETATVEDLVRLVAKKRGEARPGAKETSPEGG
jgi:acyl carrier protein